MHILYTLTHDQELILNIPEKFLNILEIYPFFSVVVRTPCLFYSSSKVLVNRFRNARATQKNFALIRTKILATSLIVVNLLE